MVLLKVGSAKWLDAAEVWHVTAGRGVEEGADLVEGATDGQAARGQELDGEAAGFELGHSNPNVGTLQGEEGELKVRFAETRPEGVATGIVSGREGAAQGLDAGVVARRGGQGPQDLEGSGPHHDRTRHHHPPRSRGPLPPPAALTGVSAAGPPA